MIRLTSKGTNSHMWWDDKLVPLLNVEAVAQDPPVDRHPGELRVGNRHYWTADPGWLTDLNE